MNDEQIEQQIQEKDKTAPRVTITDSEAAIASTHYFTAADGVAGAEICRESDEPMLLYTHESLYLLTFCVLVLKNGFTVTGESACASPENFDAEIGKAIARKNAIEKMWPLLGYELKTRLSEVAQ